MSEPKHPLRRISAGSLSSLARSQDRKHDSPSGLDFLEPALTDLADEAATLTANIQRMNEMHDALEQFNEGFAAYLYALKINAFCVEWNEAPDAHSWARLSELNAPEPEPPKPQPQTRGELGSSTASRSGSRAPTSPATTVHAGDTTYATAYASSPEMPRRGLGGRSARGGAGAGVGGMKKPAPTAASRRAAMGAQKRRQVEISKIIDSQLPLEYRGGDPDNRLVMEQVMDKLMQAENGLAISAIVSSPTLLHPRVNKALIALVAKKLVAKSSEKGKTLYNWVGQ